MTDTTAKIRAKGLDSTGVTEDIAAEMYRRKGAHYMAIVELKVEERHEKADGDKKVDLIITRVEPAVDETMAEHLRELSRVVYLNRAQYDGQATIDDQLDNERTVADVLAAGAMHKPHPFLPADVSIENGICDVCGALEAVPVHSTQDVLPDGDDETGAAQAIDDAYAQDDEFDGPHAYDAGPDDVCQCGLPFEDDSHAPGDVAADWVDSQHGDGPEAEDHDDTGWIPDQPDPDLGAWTDEPAPRATVPDPFAAGA